MQSVNLDTASRLDITSRKGDTFLLQVDFLQTMPTTGWNMHVRPTDMSEGAQNIIIDVDDTNITFSTGDGSGEDIAESLMEVTIPADTMEQIESGLYVYDIQNTDGGVVRTWLYGIFKVNEDITDLV